MKIKTLTFLGLALLLTLSGCDPIDIIPFID
jgi:hypothetical protein